MTRSEAVALALTVPGFYSEAELGALYDALAQVPERHLVLEIGVQYGRSTVILMALARERKHHLTLIDNWSESGPEAAAVFGTVTATNFLDIDFEFYKMKSKEARFRLVRDRIFDFIHIDGGHDWESLNVDCQWARQMEDGGIVCFHDYERRDHNGDLVLPDVTRAVKKYMGSWHHLGTTETLAVYRKP